MSFENGMLLTIAMIALGGVALTAFVLWLHSRENGTDTKNYHDDAKHA